MCTPLEAAFNGAASGGANILSPYSTQHKCGVMTDQAIWYPAYQPKVNSTCLVTCGVCLQVLARRVSNPIWWYTDWPTLEGASDSLILPAPAQGVPSF